MKKQDYHLIHANLAIARAPLNDPLMADFVTLGREIDALAAAAPGFIAMPTLPDTAALYSGQAMLNVSIWQSAEALAHFTHNGKHAQALSHRLAWFEPSCKPNYILFWIPAGEPPTEKEIKHRFDILVRRGPTPLAFTFKDSFISQDLEAFEAKQDQFKTDSWSV
jgi:hypothetical protein